MTTTRITSTHTSSCLAAAMICAVENLRDSDNPDWNLLTHADEIDSIAEGYLYDGVTNCRCSTRKD